MSGPGSVVWVAREEQCPQAENNWTDYKAMTMGFMRKWESTANLARSDRRASRALSLAFLFSAAFYAPLILWASNAWDLSSPWKILNIASVLFIAAIALLSAAVRLRLDMRAAALVIGAALLAFMNWALVDHIPWSVWTVVVATLGVVGHLSRAFRLSNALLALGIAAFGIAPVFQLLAAHVQQSEPYAILPLSEPVQSNPTGLVEDVLILVVDTYPSLSVAEQWFDHDTVPLEQGLTDIGYKVQRDAWSHHTYTALAVPAMLELQSVIEAGPSNRWGNLSSVYRIMRGQNLVAGTLAAAGFRYTHIESGWDASACGPEVDECKHSPWIDEMVWHLLSPTPAIDWIVDPRVNFRVSGTLNAAEALSLAARELTGNSRHDYIFAHFILPHPPVTVNGNCEPAATTDRPEWRGFSDQMSCVDSLLLEVASLFDETTAVLITADHGPGFSGQLSREPSTWSDADIAERMAIFSAYRLPDGCDPPTDNTNVASVRAVMSCSVAGELPSWEPSFIIGSDDTSKVSGDRVAAIQGGINDGSMVKKRRYSED